jgi:hypothetical protein
MDPTVVGMVQGIARSNAEAADSWERYARELERKLAWEKSDNAAARTVARALIEELARLDPKNPLASKSNRQAMYEQAFRKA